jgi:hypothetical protein
LLHPFSISFTPFCSSLRSPLPPLIQPPSNLFFLPSFFFPQIFALTFFFLWTHLLSLILFWVPFIYTPMYSFFFYFVFGIAVIFMIVV